MKLSHGCHRQRENPDPSLGFNLHLEDARLLIVLGALGYRDDIADEHRSSHSAPPGRRSPSSSNGVVDGSGGPFINRLLGARGGQLEPLDAGSPGYWSYAHGRGQIGHDADPFFKDRGRRTSSKFMEFVRDARRPAFQRRIFVPGRILSPIRLRRPSPETIVPNPPGPGASRSLPGLRQPQGPAMPSRGRDPAGRGVL